MWLKSCTRMKPNNLEPITSHQKTRRHDPKRLFRTSSAATTITEVMNRHLWLLITHYTNIQRQDQQQTQPCTCTSTTTPIYLVITHLCIQTNKAVGNRPTLQKKITTINMYNKNRERERERERGGGGGEQAGSTPANTCLYCRQNVWLQTKSVTIHYTIRTISGLQDWLHASARWRHEDWQLTGCTPPLTHYLLNELVPCFIVQNAVTPAWRSSGRKQMKTVGNGNVALRTGYHSNLKQNKSHTKSCHPCQQQQQQQQVPSRP